MRQVVLAVTVAGGTYHARHRGLERPVIATTLRRLVGLDQVTFHRTDEPLDGLTTRRLEELGAMDDYAAMIVRTGRGTWAHEEGTR